MFAAPWTGTLGPGVYENATHYPEHHGSLVSAPLSVSRPGQDCNTLVGRFVVYEVAFNSAGTVTRFAADFEQHCNGIVPALFGAVRFNSARTSLVPFDGAYPDDSIRVESPLNGYVTGPGIHCGASHTDCRESFAPATTVLLQATPEPGYIFLGWAGDCSGDSQGAVVVVGRRFCAPLFSVAPGGTGIESPNHSGGTLFIDQTLQSGAHVKQAYISIPSSFPLRSAVTPVAQWNPNSARLVQFEVFGPRESKVQMLFAAPPGTELTPGEYLQQSVPSETRLEIWGCFKGGRFQVYEYTFDASTQTVVNFAADFEAPCGDRGTMTGSIRYRSSRSSLLPFDGAYPLRELTVVSSLGGYVTGTGIDCGDDGRADCKERYAAPAMVSLQAFASPGYQFVAWSGQCWGANAATTIAVDGIPRCIAVFNPLPGSGLPVDSSATTTAMLVETLGALSPPDRDLWVTGGTSVAIWAASPSGVQIVGSSSFGNFMSDFYVASGTLEAGDYEDARFGLNGCSTLAVGRFRIYEISFDAVGKLRTFAGDFEALCESSSPLTHVVGAVRYHASPRSIVPFDGAYPLIKLTIDTAVNGIVTATGIDCGPGHTDCAEIFDDPVTLMLRATPMPGYRFVGWNGACEGASTTTVSITASRRCSAVFNAAIPGQGIEDHRIAGSAFMFQSEIGDPVGRGRRQAWLNVGMTPNASSSGYIWLNLRLGDSSHWTVFLSGPAGERLRPGTYESAVHISRAIGTSSPGLYVRDNAHECPGGGSFGRFVIHEISFASDSSMIVTALAVDWEQHCPAAGPMLRGALRFNSSRSTLRPFAPTVFDALTQTPRRNSSRDGSATLVWRHAVSGGNGIWVMDGVNARIMTGLTPAYAASVSDLAWEIRATADMNRDGSRDLIWQNSSTGEIAVWFMWGSKCIGTRYLYSAEGSTREDDLDWKIVAAGDIDLDGHGDLVWRHRISGEIRLWHMSGVVQEDAIAIGVVSDTAWEIVALGDMNGDGLPDIVWRHSVNGGIAAWFMSDAVPRRQLTMSPAELRDTDWWLVGVADVDSDGKSDLFWQNLTTGGVAVWFMDGTTLKTGRYLNPATVSDTGWRIVGVK
jgi:hypothetical protein